MKLLALTLFIVACVAEPPVDNRYLPPGTGALGLQRQTDAVFRRQPSRNGLASRRPSSQYGAPNGAPAGLNSNYLPPSSQYNAPSAPSSQYGAPNAPSSQFGAPNAPSSQYGAPNAPSTQYGAPQASSQFGSPNSQYLPPSQYSNDESLGQNTPNSVYGAPNSASGKIQRPFAGRSGPSSKYGAPNAPSSVYGAPNAQNAAPNSQYLPPSTQYGVPNQASGFGASNPSQQYGAPGFGGAGALSQGSFGGQNQGPSNQYLPPGRNGGYDDESNNEPANYSFEYMVKDEESGNDFGHRESRQGDRAEGLYYVVLPDGRKQTVEYEADQDGYKPRISYEDTGRGAGGYDRNSQSGNNGYQNDGPY